VHLDADRDAGDRTVALASQAAGADVEIHLENAAVAARQGFLGPNGKFGGILNRHRFSKQMRESDRHPFESRFYSIRDIFDVTGNTHTTSAILDVRLQIKFR